MTEDSRIKPYGCDKSFVGQYTCFRTENPPVINGHLNKNPWKKAPRSHRFVDLVTGIPGFLDTRMAALWDSTHVYIAFWLEEPDVRASLTERDSHIWQENDVEVFIAGEDCYYEFQINALGTIYEVFYIWQDAYTSGSRFDRPEFDLLTRKVDIIGGFQDNTRFGKHPRGARWAFMDWDLPGLLSAVQVQGTLNDNRDIDGGWTVELALPWQGMVALAPGRTLPPKEGDIWRMDFSRFQSLTYAGITAEPHPGWAYNKHGYYDSHIPECFTEVHFSEQLSVT